MPPKKLKLLAGQQTIICDFSLAASAVAGPSSATSSSSDSEEHRRGKGDVKAWRSFAERKWMEQYQWLDIRQDGDIVTTVVVL